MPIELKIPEVGESITEVQISQWLKSEGDQIKADEPVAVIDSEKTTFDLPAPRGGRLTKILHQAGETVRVGEAVAQIEPEGEATKEKEKPAETGGAAKAALESKSADKKPADKVQPQPSAAKPAGDKPAGKEKPNPEPAPKTEKPKPSERAETKKEKDEKPAGKDSAPEPEAEGASEPDSKDAQAASSKPVISQKPAGPKSSPGREEEAVPMTMLRRTVAKRLVEAKQQMAMLTTFGEVDMSATQVLRHVHQEAFQKRYQTKLGLMSFFVKAVIDALKQFPQLNAEIRANDIIYRNYFDLGVAIATERGLVVPVLRNAERLSFAEVERAIGDFSQRAKEGKLKPDELAGGTFTITNGGVFGSLLSTPIINPPQTAILGLHAIQERPVALNGQVVIRPMMYLALTYDHRIVDGREAVLFLRRLKEAIEAPARMLLEI